HLERKIEDEFQSFRVAHKPHRSDCRDVVLDLSNMTNQTIKLGSGLRQDSDAISAMRAGKFSYSKPNKYWVESSHKRYIPRTEDHVLGIVVDYKADNFWVDIKDSAFARSCIRRSDTKKHSQVGTLLYLRVVKTNIGMNPELSGTDASGKASVFGPLKDGFMFETSTGLSRMLLSSPTCPVLEALGKKLSFEIATGLNGRVWVNAAAPRSVIIVANAIMNSETLSATQQRIMVEKLLAKISD
ncbi:LOW QUALITY PROTEIN: hypothetical protein HID58_057214, partial [Brassica napus]